jgi:DNA polymerase-3 subunit delta
MPLLLYYGDNALEMAEAVRALRGSFPESDVLTFEGPTVPLPALSEACLTAGLFDPERLVLVRNLHQRLSGRQTAAAEEVQQVLGSLAPTTTLLLVDEDMPADHQLVGVVRELGGSVRTYMTPKKAELPRWIMARAEAHRARVEPDAADLLAELVGANPVQLDTELEKLATYAGEGQRVTLQAVESLVGAVSQDAIFGLVDAIADGKQAQALRLLRAQLERASPSPMDFALYLIRMLARQVRILLRIRLGREAGRSSGQITSELKLPRYYADRYFRQASRLSRDRLREAFERLAALEHALKSGKADPATGLELLVTEMCT